MQTKQAQLSKKGKQNRSSNRIYNKGERKLLQYVTDRFLSSVQATLAGCLSGRYHLSMYSRVTSQNSLKLDFSTSAQSLSIPFNNSSVFAP